MRRQAVVITGLALSALVLAGCGNDHDGDGLDDQTGQPVAAVRQAGDSGCNPHGVAFLQPKSCQGGGSTQADEPSAVPDPGMTPEGLALVARHEAGHKACAEHFGWSVVSVWVRLDGTADYRGRLGNTSIFGLRWKDPRQRLVVDYCGEATEDSAAHADLDEKDADEILADLPDDQRLDAEETARAEAVRITTDQAAQIDKDAAELLRDGRL